jgi:hypothetical protein
VSVRTTRYSCPPRAGLPLRTTTPCIHSGLHLAYNPFYSAYFSVRIVFFSKKKHPTVFFSRLIIPAERGLSFFKIPKILQDFPSHQIFGRIYGALNVGKKITNYSVNIETNLLSLVNP